MNLLALIPGMEGPSEIILIFFVILLLFGGKKLPELARSLGRSLNEFKRGQNEKPPVDQEEEKLQEPADEPKSAPAPTSKIEEKQGTEK